MFVSEYPILVEQLREGLYIRLDVTDKENPFRKKAFKIKNKDEIETIRGLGLTHVIYVSDRSDQLPISLEELKSQRSRRSTAKTPVSKEFFGLKRETIERNAKRREQFAACEKRYTQAMSHVVRLLRHTGGKSDESMEAAHIVVDGLVETFLSEFDVVLNLITSKPTEETKNYHALNVTVLSMMLARELELDQDALRDLGTAALFHDIGAGRVPINRIGTKGITSMNKAVKAYYREHPKIGARMVKDMPGVSTRAALAVFQHHENMDGTGFPSKTPGDRISLLARIIAIGNTFDRLCNKQRGETILTPHEALKLMYKQREKLDELLLPTFIRHIGVYPPGSVVEVSNGMIGMVISTNPRLPMRPSILVYHPEVPKREALVVDLTIEEELTIKRFIRPAELSREVYTYLSPGGPVNLYAEALQPSGV
ncbi:HD-GYP domain-containing protein [Desulfovibrio inopinatus]|uniref:HD-GYP domain-containing protein n=1 Tax=Desulfovibrio inopinatus TaxID=102109 RepID=UPI000414FA13|nr:HD-GYP domain-containing protein [Desulfovibrio inopinatus]